MSEDSVKNLGSIVPEVYYDLISRVPPGTFVVICFWTLYRSKSGLSVALPTDAATAAFVTLVLVGAGYAAGLLLSPLGRTIVEWPFRRRWDATAKRWAICRQMLSKLEINWQNPNSTERLEQGESQACEFVQRERRLVYRRLHEFLKDVDIQARVILPKINAERSFCGNAVAAISLILITVIFVKFSWLLVWWLTVGLGLSFWACWDRTTSAVERHFSYFALQIKTAEMKKTVASSRGAALLG